MSYFESSDVNFTDLRSSLCSRGLGVARDFIVMPESV